MTGLLFEDVKKVFSVGRILDIATWHPGGQIFDGHASTGRVFLRGHEEVDTNAAAPPRQEENNEPGAVLLQRFGFWLRKAIRIEAGGRKGEARRDRAEGVDTCVGREPKKRQRTQSSRKSSYALEAFRSASIRRRPE